MKLLKTIEKLVEESQKAYDIAAEKGVSEKELDRLEKNLQQTRRLMKLYGDIGKTNPEEKKIT
jgi:hypothetical protein